MQIKYILVHDVQLHKAALITVVNFNRLLSSNGRARTAMKTRRRLSANVNWIFENIVFEEGRINILITLYKIYITDITYVIKYTPILYCKIYNNTSTSGGIIISRCYKYMISLVIVPIIRIVVFKS